MALRVYVYLVCISTQWLLYLLMNLVFSALQKVIWLLNGTSWALSENTKPENYTKSAHVMNVVFKYRLDLFIESRISDYVLTHDSFVQPEYVLSDDVSFMQITEKEAIFVQRRKGSSAPFEYNFTMLGQFDSAEKVITMPLSSFNKLADSLGNSDAKIVFLQNQSRCGGTLFTDIFKFSGRCVTYNEPHAINAACKFHYMKGRWSRDVMKKMLKNIVRVLCKPYKGLPAGKPLAYVIKPTATSTMCADVVGEVFPDAIQFFIYRNPVNVAISLRRLGQALDTLKLMFYLPNIPYMIAPLFRFIGYCEMDFRGWTPKKSQELEFGYRVAVLTMKYYLQYRGQGIQLHGIRYEILRDNPEKIAQKVFNMCDLPHALIGKSLEAMGRDSQGETVFSQSILQKVMPDPPKATPEFMEIARQMSREFNVPGPDGWEETGFYLPGSLQP